MGPIDWNSHIAAPNSGVFYNPTSNQYTYCAFNTKNVVQQFNVYKGSAIIGQLRVPANSFYSAHTLDGNTPPTVQISSPIDQSMVTDKKAVVTVTASASDLEGPISKVEFYCNGSLLKTFEQPPYSTTMTNFADDTTYSLYAKAYDNQGASTFSDNVAFNVNIPADTCSIDGVHTDFSAVVTTKKNPYIVFKPKVNCAWVNVACYKGKGGKINMGAWGMTKAGSNFITQVLNVAVGDSLRFWFTWGLAEGGQRDNSGTPDSLVVAACIGVVGNIRPTVSLTSPINGTIFNNNNSITLSAIASDIDGTISKVEFYNGNALLGTTTQLPYNLSLSNLIDGTNYSVFAKAYDNQNSFALSNTVNFSIDIPSDTCRFTSQNADFIATMTGKANPTLTFIPQSPIAGCNYVIINVKVNGNNTGSWYMTKNGTVFTSTFIAKIDDNLEWYFTYQTPPAGERNNSTSACVATVGGCGSKTGFFTPYVSDLQSLKLFPNPANNCVSIYVSDLNSNEVVKLTVTDLSGKIIIKSNVKSDSNGVLNYKLDFQNSLSQGMYVISLLSENTFYRNQLLVQKEK